METQYFLRERGLRVTPQRQLIIKILLGTKEHPTAEILFEKVKELFPALSLNTVYKTLELFEEKGIIKRFNVGVNIYRYDANITPHAHIICLKCNRVEDINGKYSQLTKEIKEDVDGFNGYNVLSAEIYIYGLCSRCGGGEVDSGSVEMQ